MSAEAWGRVDALGELLSKTRAQRDELLAILEAIAHELGAGQSVEILPGSQFHERARAAIARARGEKANRCRHSSGPGFCSECYVP